MAEFGKMTVRQARLRLTNARLRMDLIAQGRWPAPAGWAVRDADLPDWADDDEPAFTTENIAERLTEFLAQWRAQRQ